ncbi:hypothetical protein QJ857_gp1019 [Tupanvirus soda lake]|uniref:Uncharacterized protein n=2 Tax=Tupanvirus TaxID=2094720 RepID=A0A6N1NJZ1_9VIRU|nr:hypothetical protein QJ857_gp1019 [Tupanvirus soda lake]QKU35035.1 hypothetical protein [Tupanvirus soda lake]
MFFLITHILIGKYYPSLITQFIIGCTCYILSFLIIKDIISAQCFEQYKYYALSLIAVDTSFIIYKAKCSMNETKEVQPFQTIEIENKPENTTSDIRTGSLQSITLSSELNDFKITHDLSLSEPDNEDSMFSTSDEKSEEKEIDPAKLSATSTESINQNFDIFK